MIITFVKVQSMAGKRRELQQTLESLASLTQTDAGCLESSLYQRVEDETDFLLLGAWQSRMALDEYLQSSRFSVLLGAKWLMSRPPEMAIHTVAASTEFRSLYPEHSTTDR
jgi:quinol monooxygenase YgiN